MASPDQSPQLGLKGWQERRREGLANGLLSTGFINTVTYSLRHEEHFPLTLILSTIGGEGKRWDRLMLCHHKKPGDPIYPLAPASGGEGWGEGGDI